MMPNTIQSREYSRGSDDKGGVLYISAELERQPEMINFYLGLLKHGNTQKLRNVIKSGQ